MGTQVMWNPQEQGLKEICSLLQEHRPPSSDQARIFQKLQQFTLLPDFNNYLAFILCHGEVTHAFPSLNDEYMFLLLYKRKRKSYTPWDYVLSVIKSYCFTRKYKFLYHKNALFNVRKYHLWGKGRAFRTRGLYYNALCQKRWTQLALRLHVECNNQNILLYKERDRVHMARGFRLKCKQR